MSPCGTLLIFRSGSSLVSAGPLHTISAVLCDILYTELSSFTGFQKTSTLSALWLWWRVTLWSTAFHYPDCFIPPLFLSSRSKKFSLCFTVMWSSATSRTAFQGITFYSSHSPSMPPHPQTNTVPFLREILWKNFLPLILNEGHLWLGCLILCSQCLGQFPPCNTCLPIGREKEGGRKWEK